MRIFSGRGIDTARADHICTIYFDDYLIIFQLK
jgi:hypothetical protein